MWLASLPPNSYFFCKLKLHSDSFGYLTFVGLFKEFLVDRVKSSHTHLILKRVGNLVVIGVTFRYGFPKASGIMRLLWMLINEMTNILIHRALAHVILHICVNLLLWKLKGKVKFHIQFLRVRRSKILASIHSIITTFCGN